MPCRQRELGLAALSAERFQTNAAIFCRYMNKSDVSCRSFWQTITESQSPEINFRIPVQQKHPGLIWTAGRSSFQRPLCDLMNVREIPGGWEYAAEEKALFDERAASAFRVLEREVPAVFSCLCASIPYLLMARRDGYGGGSVSSRIGLIWLSPSQTWTDEVWAENILHEFVHNMLFVEELVNSIFSLSVQEMEEGESLAMSAIRRTPRGYDKSFHSAFVSYAITQFYLMLGRKKKALELIPGLIVCVDDLVTKKRALTRNGLDLLNQLVDGVLRFGRQHLARPEQPMPVT
ncbi:MAG: hypothetical protein DCC68_23150 [Planctomycetota bacterium]|nr:MAG: hypothetical protein DCC68_23150 [Planctomycetota bacterium]